MIDTEKVRILYKLAEYDKNYGEKDRPMGRYFRKDYIVREMLKSFFAGTLVYILILVMWGMYRINAILESLNTTDFLKMAIVIGFCYIAFMAIYLLITYLVHYVRYNSGRRRLKKYYGRLYVVDYSDRDK